MKFALLEQNFHAGMMCWPFAGAVSAASELHWCIYKGFFLTPFRKSNHFKMVQSKGITLNNVERGPSRKGGSLS